MRERESLLGKPGYAYRTLDEREQDAYLQLYETIANRDVIRMADFPQLSNDEVSRLLACIDMDHPELFWMDGYQNRITMGTSIEDDATTSEVWRAFLEGIDYDQDGKISLFERSLAAARVAFEASPTIQWAIKDELRLLPPWPERTVRSVQETFDAYVSDCKRYVPEAEDDYQVFRRIFEYVARHTSFSARRAAKAQDVRSVFLNRESVCKGYAEALQYLLLTVGIPCFTVQGTADSGPLSQSVHAWNYVLIDGVWNIVDITAGDWDLELKPELLPSFPEAIRDQFVDYRCMSLDGDGYHPAEIVEYPAAGTTGDYFDHEGFTLRQGDWVSLAGIYLRLFNRSEPFAMVHCEGDFDELETWMDASLEQVVKTCVAAGGSYESFMADPEHFRALVPRVRERDVTQTGWGGFRPSIEMVFPGEDTFVITAPAKPPVRVQRY